jgi:hypothetical protein
MFIGHDEEYLDIHEMERELGDFPCVRVGVKLKLHEFGGTYSGVWLAQFGKCNTQILDEPPQKRDGGLPVRCVPGATDCGAEILVRLAIEGEETEHRQVTPRVVEAIEETELLSAMGGIYGRIEIDRDAPRSTSQAMAIVLDDEIGQRGTHAIERQRAKAILEARQGRLRSQRITVDRITTDEQFVDRVLGKPSRVVAVGVTARESEHPLANELRDVVAHASESAGVVNAVGKPSRETQPGVDRLQQDGPRIGCGPRLVEGHLDRPAKKSWKQNALCRRIRSQEKASSVLKLPLDKLFLARGGFFVFNFVNNPG